MEQQKNIPADLMVTVKYLRKALRTKTGVLNGKRHEYFKGSHALKAVQRQPYLKIHPKSLPPVTDEASAVQLLHSIIPFAYFLRVDRGDQSIAGAKLLKINQMQMFQQDHFYIWFYDGSQLKTMLGGIGMVFVILAGVMFPLWPASLRIGVWYLSIAMLGLIGLFFAVAIVRLILYVITYFAAPPGLWIFPNLFEDVGFIDSFIPGYAWDYPPPKKSVQRKAEKAERAAVKERARAAKLEKRGESTANSSAAGTPRIVELDDDE